jgi:hypothetical protein
MNGPRSISCAPGVGFHHYSETGARTWQARYRLLGRIRSIRGIGRTPPPAPPAPKPPKTPNWREIASA